MLERMVDDSLIVDQPRLDEPDPVTIEFGARKVVQEYEDQDAFGVDASEIKMPPVLRQQYEKMQKAYVGVEGAKSKAGHEKASPNAYDLLDIAHPAYNLEYLIRMYETDYAHYAAVNAKVANVVGLGYDFVESDKTMEKEDKMDEDTERIQRFRRNLSRTKRLMFDKLDSLNEEEEFIESIEKFVIDYEVTGNGYLEIGRTKSGQIGYIGHIPSHTIRIRRKRDGFVQLVDGKPIFFKKFGDTKTGNPVGGDSRPNELIHIKKYTPKDNYYGAPDIIPALSAVAGNRFADEFNLDYFENKAVPRNLIIVRGGAFDRDAQRKLMKFFGEDLKGTHHRALYIPLPAETKDQGKSDVEIKSVESGVQDSAFKEYSQSNVEKILMVHRVPASKLGMSGNNALAAAKDLDKTFKEQVCRPLQRVIEKKINRVVKEITDIFEFKLNELDLTDEVSQASIDRGYHSIGVVTANEIRARMGRPGLKGGDKTVFEIEEEQAKVGANAAGRSEANSQRTQSRSRDSERVVGRTDSVGAARNPKGEGRSYE